MNKEFIPYEEAIALKELGFDELCLAYYQKSSVIGDDTILPLIIRKEATNWNDNSFSKLGVPFYSAPLYQQAFRWFREKYNMNICIQGFYNNSCRYSYTYRIYNHLHQLQDYEFNADTVNTYEVTELGCLKKLIEIVKDDG